MQYFNTRLELHWHCEQERSEVGQHWFWESLLKDNSDSKVRILKLFDRKVAPVTLHSLSKADMQELQISEASPTQYFLKHQKNTIKDTAPQGPKDFGYIPTNVNLTVFNRCITLNLKYDWHLKLYVVQCSYQKIGFHPKQKKSKHQK